PPTSTLFPYTTLFRSRALQALIGGRRARMPPLLGRSGNPIQYVGRRPPEMLRFGACVSTVAFSLVFAHRVCAADVSGTVRDETGGALPGVTVEAHASASDVDTTATDTRGAY